MNQDWRTNKDRAHAIDARTAAFDRLSSCAAVLDSDGFIVHTNRAWRLFAHLNEGTPETTGVGVNYLEVCDRAAIAGAAASAHVAAGLRRILGGDSGHVDLEYPCPSPTEDRWFLFQASAVPLSDGAGAVVCHLDITARKQLTDRLNVLSEHDSLTGLPNRRAAVRQLDEHLGVARLTGEPVSVLFVDIDEFKGVNDTFGHHVGDELLVKVGLRARRAIRDTDGLYRFGGDELVVVCPGLQHAPALLIAERLRTVMATPFQVGDLEVFGRVSVGVAESDPASTTDTLLRRADQDMYTDKRRHRTSTPRGEVPAATASRGQASGTRTTGEPQPHGDQTANHHTRAAAALMNSNDLILFLTADGLVEWASPACMRLLGVRQEAIVGRNAIDLVHPDDQTSVVVAFTSIPNIGDHVRTEFRVVDANGRIRWIEEIATNLLSDPAVGSIVGNLRDVTERVGLLERIELDRRRLNDAQAAARLGSFEIDLQTGDIARSDELCRILGVPVGSTANASELDTIHPDDRAKLTSMLAQAMIGTEQGELEYRIVRPDGEVRWVLTQGAKLAAPNDDIIAGTMLDITERHTAQEALSFQATHDWLTQLPNASSVHSSLQSILHTASVEAELMVAVIGIDNFHHVNDAYGTLAADAVLRALATRLAAQSQPGDIVGRVRGDEFVVARTGLANARGALQFGRTLKDLASEPLPTTVDRCSDPPLSFSIGVTTSTRTDTPESLLADADAAMREAKRDGGDRVAVFDDNARARATRHRDITAALPVALARNQLRLEYQPIVDLATLQTVGFEALIRWTHPDLGTIPPDEFIPIAEANRLIVPIGTWVLESAVRQLAAWRNDPNLATKPWMAINLSAQQLAHGQLVPQLAATIDRHRVPASAVHLEITESILMDRIEHASQTVADLRALGVNISVDDFGTGYSSLSYLSRLTVDTIKIDRSFINDLMGARDGTSILQAMMTLASSLDLDVIAEGVETDRQLSILKGLGCPKAQGFLWSRSLHPDVALQRMIHDSDSDTDAQAPAQHAAMNHVTPPRPTQAAELSPATLRIASSANQRRQAIGNPTDLLRFGTP